MSIRFSLVLVLGLIVTAIMGLGCGAAPASQSTDGESAPQPSVSAPAVKVTESAPVSQPSASVTTVKATESAPVSQPSALVAAAKVEVEAEAETVEVGYEVGMRAPEFGMSLLDGTKVTSSDLANEGKPVFLYFHATF